jgi:integrase
MKLTKNEVDKLRLPDGRTDHIFWDDGLPGFGVRCRGPNKTFIIQYRVGRQQRRESLGDVRRIPLEAARTIARRRFAAVELGGDPGAERAKLREAVVLTLDDAAKRYVEAKKDRHRLSTHKAIKRHFDVHFATLSQRPLVELHRREVAAQLQTITKEYGRTVASRARSTLSSLFSWAMKEGLCENSPVIGTNDPLAGIDNSRDRVLSDTELLRVWQACADDDFGRIIKLLILTGCRRNEIGVMKWAELDLESGILTISGDRTKVGKAHVLTLPQAALHILQSIERRSGRDYVFGQRGEGFQRWGVYTTALRERLGDMPAWTLHDLRRTFRTGLGRLGIPSHIAELAIGHTRQGIQAVYDRHTYEREIGAALARWAEHLGAIVAGERSKVVAMPKGGVRR